MVRGKSIPVSLITVSLISQAKKFQLFHLPIYSYSVNTQNHYKMYSRTKTTRYSNHATTAINNQVKFSFIFAKPAMGINITAILIQTHFLKVEKPQRLHLIVN